MDSSHYELGSRQLQRKMTKAGRSSISKMGSWLDHLLTQVTSPRGQKQRDSEKGLPVMTVHVVSTTVSFSAGPEEAATVWLTISTQRLGRWPGSRVW